jgi:hypothetical protein
MDYSFAMNSKAQEDVIAGIVLRDLEKRELLKTIVNQSGFAYYTSRPFMRLGFILISATLLAWLLLRSNVPTWGLILYIFASIGSAEATRQRHRCNALLELIELEKQEANKPRVAIGDAVSR